MKQLAIETGDNWADHPEQVDFALMLSVVEDTLLIRLIEFWSALRRDGLPPARSDIDPRDLGPDLLPQIVLFECVERDGRPDCRYRLCGAALVERLGLDPTGTFIGDLIPDSVYADQMIKQVHLPLTTGLPVFSHGEHVPRQSDAPTSTTKRVVMPLRPLPDGTPLTLAGQVHVLAAGNPLTTAEMKPVYRSKRYVQFT